MQLTHGRTACISKLSNGQQEVKFATAMEHFAAQGWKMFPDEEDPSVSPMKNLLADYSRCDLLRLAGRGIHLTVFSAWLLSILSKCVRMG